MNPSPYLFFTRTPGFEVVGASPELLVQVVGDRMSTHPIAGTRPRGTTPADDDRLADELRRDPKERAEHVMLVDLGRNDLGRVARPGTVSTSQYMEVERYSHVLHLVSHVEARLRPELDALDALRSVFPAGTLTGAPKIRAMQLIAAAEGERRGLYGGAVGYLGYDGNLDTAITIRSAVLKDGQAHVHTGAGIVARSVPESEFEETEHKAAALRRAIELAAAPAAPRPSPAGRGRPARLQRVPPTAGGRRPMILMIDNYDSFTFNLVQALQAAGADVRVIRNDQITRAEVEAMADDPGRGPARHRHLARARRPRLGRRERRHDRGRRRARDPAPGRLPRHAVDGGRLGRLDRPRTDARPRRGQRRPPRRRGPPRGHAAGLPGRPLPLPVRGSGHAPRGPLRDRHQPGRRRRDGPAPPHAAHRGRPVPPGVRAHAGRPAPARQLPPPRRGGGGVAARRGDGLVRDAGHDRGRRRGPGPTAVPSGAPATAGTTGPPDERAGPGRRGGDRRGPDAVHGRRAPGDGRGDGRRGDALAAGGPAHGPADARRDRRRAGGLRVRDARARRPGGGARRARSTSWAPAATAPGPSTSPRPRR